MVGAILRLRDARACEIVGGVCGGGGGGGVELFMLLDHSFSVSMSHIYDFFTPRRM